MEENKKKEELIRELRKQLEDIKNPKKAEEEGETKPAVHSTTLPTTTIEMTKNERELGKYESSIPSIKPEGKNIKIDIKKEWIEYYEKPGYSEEKKCIATIDEKVKQFNENNFKKDILSSINLYNRKIEDNGVNILKALLDSTSPLRIRYLDIGKINNKNY